MLAKVIKITMEEMLFNFIIRISMLSVVLFEPHVNINNHHSIVLMMMIGQRTPILFKMETV